MDDFTEWYEQVLARTERDGECLLYQGLLDSGGYGVTQRSGVRRPAHRVAYQSAYGLLEKRQRLRATCGRNHCVNPAHWKLIGSPDGVKKHSTRQSCLKGHPFTEANTLWAQRGEYLVRRCATCLQDARLKHKYGITGEQYAEMLEAQGGVCAICGRECQSRNRLAVDHCHETGKVRGLLCAHCNRALGMLGDSVNVLTAAVRYLERSEL